MGGNRGLDAQAGDMLGSVPAEVSRKAQCSVLIVHTTRHAEDLEAMTDVVEIRS